MKTTFKWLLILSMALALLAVIGGAALWQEIAAQPDVSISINGEDIDVHGVDAVSWIGAVAGVLVAGVVICIVLPLVLLLGLGLPLLLLGIGLACALLGVFSVGAIFFSPLILLGLLVWWMLRSKKAPAPKAEPRLSTNPEPEVR